MLKRFTVNALLVGRPALLEAKKRLRSMGVRRSDIDYISHLDKNENSVQIEKSHKGYVCLSYGFFIGIFLGVMICLLNESLLINPVGLMALDVIVPELWRYISATSFVGAVLGYVSGRGIVQYSLRYGKGDTAPSLHYLLMVNVEREECDKVIEALKPVSDNVDYTDNNKAVELGLNTRESY